MKSSFDKLENAGYMMPNSADERNIADVLSLRVSALKNFAGKIEKVQNEMLVISSLKDKVQRLRRITAVLTALNKLAGNKLPTGCRKLLDCTMNEIVSVREAVFTSAVSIDKASIQLLSAANIKRELDSLIIDAEAKLSKVSADYEGDSVNVEKYGKEKNKADALRSKKFVLTRLPVVPTDVVINMSLMHRNGLAADQLGGYVVLPDQLVIGINPKSVDTSKKEPLSVLVKNEASKLLRLIEQQQHKKLHFVAETSHSYGGGSWFWVMSSTDLQQFKRALGGRVHIKTWGFAF